MALEKHVRVDPLLNQPFLIIHRVSVVPIVFYFPLAPQHVDVEHPARVAIHQTIGDNYVDDFSGARSVLSKVELGGTFGFDKRAGGAFGVPLPGSAHLRIFEGIYETFNGLDRSIKSRLGAAQEYVGLSRLHFWRIVIEDLQYRADKTNPLLWFYKLRFRRVQDYLSPVGLANQVADGLPALGSLGGLF
jgi:hypothetical protein